MLNKYLVDYNNYINEFSKLLNSYKDWNSKINISSIDDDREIIIKHFEDSLLWNKVISFSWKKVLDIWTWWGFPLLPLAITNPHASFIWLDSVQKKLTVIQNIAKEIWLQNVNILHARAEDAAHDKKYREQFDIVTTRAFSKWSALLEMSLPFLKIWWTLLAYQTSSIKDEMKEKDQVLQKLWWKLEWTFDFKLSDDMWERLFIVIKKIKPSPANYPRPAWVPKDKPL